MMDRISILFSLIPLAVLIQLYECNFIQDVENEMLYGRGGSGNAAQVRTYLPPQQQHHTSSSTSYQQQSSEEKMTEWQKVAMKEKKHVQYAQESHFSKVRWN